MKTARKRTPAARRRRSAVKGPGQLAAQLLRLAFCHSNPDYFLRTSGLLYREA